MADDYIVARDNPKDATLEELSYYYGSESTVDSFIFALTDNELTILLEVLEFSYVGPQASIIVERMIRFRDKQNELAKRDTETT
jgi:hypothetical protein